MRRQYLTLSQDGLLLGHAYTVLRAANVGKRSSRNGNDYDNRLLRLRGPLPAREGWRGEWADDSPRWTPEAAAAAAAAASAAAQCTGRNTPPDDLLKTPQDAYEEEEEGGQAFWVSIGEAVSSFVEAGVCFAPSPGSETWAPPAGAVHGPHSPRRRRGVSGWWAQEARRRVVLRKKRGAAGRGGGGSMRAAAALRKGGTAAGRNRGKDGEGEEDGRWGWAASQVYALSVYETSRMFFSLHQVGDT